MLDVGVVVVVVVVMNTANSVSAHSLIQASVAAILQINPLRRLRVFSGDRRSR